MAELSGSSFPFSPKSPFLYTRRSGGGSPLLQGLWPLVLAGGAPPAGRLIILVAPILGLPTFSKDPDQRAADLMSIRGGPAFAAWVVHSPCRALVTELSAALPGTRLCTTALVPSSALLCQASAYVQQVCMYHMVDALTISNSRDRVQRCYARHRPMRGEPACTTWLMPSP